MVLQYCCCSTVLNLLHAQRTWIRWKLTHCRTQIFHLSPWDFLIWRKWGVGPTCCLPTKPPSACQPLDSELKPLQKEFKFEFTPMQKTRNPVWKFFGNKLFTNEDGSSKWAICEVLKDGEPCFPTFKFCVKTLKFCVSRFLSFKDSFCMRHFCAKPFNR